MCSTSRSRLIRAEQATLAAWTYWPDMSWAKSQVRPLKAEETHNTSFNSQATEAIHHK